MELFVASLLSSVLTLPPEVDAPNSGMASIPPAPAVVVVDALNSGLV